jgi:predicted DNA binding protein
MSVICEFSVPASSFALEETLASNEAAVVEAERMATHSTMQVMPFLWESGCDAAAFCDALDADPTIETASVSEDTDGGTLFKVEWTESFRDLIDAMVDHRGSLVEASGSDDTWHLELRFAEEGHVSEFQEYFHDEGRKFELTRLYRPSAPRQREYNLTPEQYDTLVAAYRAGYFDVPRESSTSDIAEELGISANAVSARLRRASKNLVDTTLVVDDQRERGR